MIYTLIIFLIFTFIVYFLIARPQGRDLQSKSLMQQRIQEDSIVYTIDGIKGKVKEIKKNKIRLQTEPNGIIILVNLDHIEKLEGYDYEALVKESKKKRKKK